MQQNLKTFFYEKRNIENVIYQNIQNTNTLINEFKQNEIYLDNLNIILDKISDFLKFVNDNLDLNGSTSTFERLIRTENSVGIQNIILDSESNNVKTIENTATDIIDNDGLKNNQKDYLQQEYEASEIIDFNKIELLTKNYEDFNINEKLKSDILSNLNQIKIDQLNQVVTDFNDDLKTDFGFTNANFDSSTLTQNVDFDNIDISPDINDYTNDLVDTYVADYLKNQLTTQAKADELVDASNEVRKVKLKEEFQDKMNLTNDHASTIITDANELFDDTLNANITNADDIKGYIKNEVDNSINNSIDTNVTKRKNDFIGNVENKLKFEYDNNDGNTLVLETQISDLDAVNSFVNSFDWSSSSSTLDSNAINSITTKFKENMSNNIGDIIESVNDTENENLDTINNDLKNVISNGFINLTDTNFENTKLYKDLSFSYVLDVLLDPIQKNIDQTLNNGGFGGGGFGFLGQFDINFNFIESELVGLLNFDLSISWGDRGNLSLGNFVKEEIKNKIQTEDNDNNDSNFENVVSNNETTLSDKKEAIKIQFQVFINTDNKYFRGDSDTLYNIEDIVNDLSFTNDNDEIVDEIVGGVSVEDLTSQELQNGYTDTLDNINSDTEISLENNYTINLTTEGISLSSLDETSKNNFKNTILDTIVVNQNIEETTLSTIIEEGFSTFKNTFYIKVSDEVQNLIPDDNQVVNIDFSNYLNDNSYTYESANKVLEDTTTTENILSNSNINNVITNTYETKRNTYQEGYKSDFSTFFVDNYNIDSSTFNNLEFKGNNTDMIDSSFDKTILKTKIDESFDFILDTFKNDYKGTVLDTFLLNRNDVDENLMNELFTSIDTRDEISVSESIKNIILNLFSDNLRLEIENLFEIYPNYQNNSLVEDTYKITWNTLILKHSILSISFIEEMYIDDYIFEMKHKINDLYGFDTNPFHTILMENIPGDIYSASSDYEKEIIEKAYLPFSNPIFVKTRVHQNLHNWIFDIFEKEILNQIQFKYIKYMYYEYILDFESYMHYIRFNNKYTHKIIDKWNQKQDNSIYWNILSLSEFLNCPMTIIEKNYAEKNISSLPIFQTQVEYEEHINNFLNDQNDKYNNELATADTSTNDIVLEIKDIHDNTYNFKRGNVNKKITGITSLVIYKKIRVIFYFSEYYHREAYTYDNRSLNIESSYTVNFEIPIDIESFTLYVYEDNSIIYKNAPIYSGTIIDPIISNELEYNIETNEIIRSKKYKYSSKYKEWKLWYTSDDALYFNQIRNQIRKSHINENNMKKNKWIEENIYIEDLYSYINDASLFLNSVFRDATLFMNQKQFQKIDTFSYYVYKNSLISKKRKKKLQQILYFHDLQKKKK